MGCSNQKVQNHWLREKHLSGPQVPVSGDNNDDLRTERSSNTAAVSPAPAPAPAHQDEHGKERTDRGQKVSETQAPCLQLPPNLYPSSPLVHSLF